LKRIGSVLIFKERRLKNLLGWKKKNLLKI
jgi:hypothetical protein